MQYLHCMSEIFEGNANSYRLKINSQRYGEKEKDKQTSNSTKDST